MIGACRSLTRKMGDTGNFRSGEEGVETGYDCFFDVFEGCQVERYWLDIREYTASLLGTKKLHPPLRILNSFLGVYLTLTLLL